MSTGSAQTAAVLLCGGSSERLGFPKEMIRVDGAPLAVRMLQRLQRIFPRVLISSNRPGYLRHLVDVPIVEDDMKDVGPLGGVLTGLRRAGAEQVFFLACDLAAIPDEVINDLVARAGATDAETVLAASGNQFLCAVHRAALATKLERFLTDGGRAVHEFLEGTRVERVEFPAVEPWRFKDVDEPGDLWVLGKVFDDVEPLPVKSVPMCRVRGEGGEAAGHDLVAEEWPIAVFANGVKLATVLCLPNALFELAVGFASYLGLVDKLPRVRAVRVDYQGRRAEMRLDVEDSRLKSAVQMLVTSTCGASVYGSELPALAAPGADGGFRASASHVLECLQALRSMAPVFERTGGTHQVAFTDGERIRHFFEDIGRHNAMDKVIGRALLDGCDLSRGAVVSTGRISSEMVVKAVRQRIPVLASKGAVTSGALELAEAHGLTVVGFARGGRMNVYTAPGRITQE